MTSRATAFAILAFLAVLAIVLAFVVARPRALRDGNGASTARTPDSSSESPAAPLSTGATADARTAITRETDVASGDGPVRFPVRFWSRCAGAQGELVAVLRGADAREGRIELLRTGTTETLEVPSSGEYTLSWSHPAWTSGERRFTVPFEGVLEIEIDSLTAVRGELVAAETGEPITNASAVLAARRPVRDDEPEGRELTAEFQFDLRSPEAAAAAEEVAGRFCLTPIWNEEIATLRLLVDAVGREHFDSGPLPLGRITDLGRVELRRLAGCTAQVTVVDARTGAPVQGAYVRSHPPDTRFEDLRCSFDAGIVQYHVIDTREPDERAFPGVDWRYELRIAEDKTDTSGRARLAFAWRPEPLCISVWAPDREPFLSQPIDLAPGPEPNELRIELTGGAEIHGELRLPEAVMRSVGCIVVTVESPRLRREEALPLQATGPFVFAGLLPGEYELSAFTCPDGGQRVLAARQRVWLAESERKDVLLDCAGTGETAVRARVVGPPSARPSSKRMQAAAPEIGWYRDGWSTVDGSMSVECRTDGPTLITIQGPTDAGACFWFRMVDGPGDLGTIDLSRNRVVFDAAGAELDAMPSLRPLDGPSGVSIVLTPELESTDRYAVWGLPTGPYELVLDDGRRQRIEVPESGTVTVR